LPDDLARGTRVSSTLAEHAQLLARMRAGEPVALKSVTNQTVGLPFFNADRPVSTMTILATGRGRSVDVVGGTLIPVQTCRGAAGGCIAESEGSPVPAPKPARL
jgi:hypothetical protein